MLSTKASTTSPSIQKRLYGDEDGMQYNVLVSPSRINDSNNEQYETLGNADFDTNFIDDMDEDENEEMSESQIARKKRYEAFVMTGDRMINLAKTPANNDFRSKYYKPSLEPIPLLEDESASLPSSPPPVVPLTTDVQDQQITKSNDTAAEQSREGGYFDLADQGGSDSNVVVRLRSQPQRNRSSVR